jgi:hypothetical protein
VSQVALDHLIVAAATLEQGAAWCEATLGLAPGPGGKHALFGTHNRLLKIATPAFPQAYLEIIAIDPEAPPPQRPRWFGLDEATLQARLRDEGPRLIHVVARSTMLDMHRWGLITVGLQPGEPVAASRQTPQGLLSWQILVRPDGALPGTSGASGASGPASAAGPAPGALPTLIQWSGEHPTTRMPDSGVTLRELHLHGLPPRAADVLRLRGVHLDPGPGPALRARLETPRGAVELVSP